MLMISRVEDIFNPNFRTSSLLMSLIRVHFLSPKPSLQSAAIHLLQTNSFPHSIAYGAPAQSNKHVKIETSVSCTNQNGINDAELASDLATEVEKLNTHLAQREEAMTKSRELLFSELCRCRGLKPEELKKQWNRMDEAAKLDLVEGFVSDWGSHFHPLSARSVRDMIDEHLQLVDGDGGPSSSSSAPALFHGLKKIMGIL